MKKTMQSPAPWTKTDAIIYDKHGDRIADCDFGTVDDDANARLMSAAPDLLDALCIALPFVEDHEDSNIYKAGAVAKALRTIRAAIEKAEA